MSEIINNRKEQLDHLKSLILKLNSGSTPESVKNELKQTMRTLPYEDVVTVEQELFEEGQFQDNMLELCDLHSAAMKGLLQSVTGRNIPDGHPVHTLLKENQAIHREIMITKKIIDEISILSDNEAAGELLTKIHSRFNNIMDIEKHYQKKEYLIFPFLEKYNISGPSKVMWGKHDQTRQLLKNANEILLASHNVSAGDAKAIIEITLLPAINSLDEMIYKEENILYPMALDTFKDEEWLDILNQYDEFGYCLFEPTVEWKPENINSANELVFSENKKIKLPTGAFTVPELTSMFNAMPVDITFVDKDDYVRFFSEGKERIFQRGKAILGRKVQFCHPPSSVHIVDKILNDFKTGTQSKAAFWINMGGKFVYISYFALRDEKNNYMGTMEVTQDLTELRKLDGERRILSYE